VAERLAQVEMVGDREQAVAGHPQQAIRLVYRLLHRIQSSSPPRDGRSIVIYIGNYYLHVKLLFT
jgi:hypothetical protein